MWAFYGILWAKGDNLIEISYLKAHPSGNRYPEWMPNLHSDPATREFGDPKATKAQAVPLYHGGPGLAWYLGEQSSVFFYKHKHQQKDLFTTKHYKLTLDNAKKFEVLPFHPRQPCLAASL